MNTNNTSTKFNKLIENLVNSKSLKSILHSDKITVIDYIYLKASVTKFYPLLSTIAM